MDERTFKNVMAKAKTFWDERENKDYWRGYIRGLRRCYHGENFGTNEEHEQWMNMIKDEDRKELGRGYRDGYNYGRDCQINKT